MTLLEPVMLKVPYGETVLPRGLRLPFVSRSAQTVTVRYMGREVALPVKATDQR
ncbi:hypothetical protein BH20VER1_BH20VER1_00650 [soil metagenome]